MQTITDTFTVISIVDGTSPVILDLDNDNDTIVINEAGQMIIPNGMAIARLFVGDELVTSGMMWDAYYNGINIFDNNPECMFRIIDNGDVTQDGNYIGRKLDIEDLNTLIEGKYSIEIGCTYQGHRYTAIWSITIMKGLSKTELSVTPSVVAYNTSTSALSHTSFAIKAALKQQDSTTQLTTLPSGYSLRYYTDAFTGTPSKNNGTALNYSGGQATLGISAQNAASYKFYRFILWDASGNIADEETVPIAKATDGKDGKDGKDGQDGQDGQDGDDGNDGNGVLSVSIQYLRTIQPSGVNASTSGDWGAYAEPTAILPYLWKRTVTTYQRTVASIGSDTVVTCELLKTYQPGVGQNMLEGTSFADMSVVKKNWRDLGLYTTRPTISGYAYRTTAMTYGITSSPSTRPSLYSYYPAVIPEGYCRWEGETMYYVKSGQTVTYSSQLQYAVSSSPTSLILVSGKGWRTTTYTLGDGEYLWMQRVYTFKDGNGNTITPEISETAVVRIIYRYPSTGYGFNGIGITKVGVQGHKAYASSVQFGSGNIGEGLVMMDQSVAMESSMWYTISFFAKRSYENTSDGDVSYLVNNYTPLIIAFQYTQTVIDTTAGVFLNGAAATDVDGYLNLGIPLTDSYKEYVITFKVVDSSIGSPTLRFFQPQTGAARYHSEVAISMLKLEPGQIATGWNDTAAGIRTDAHPIPKPAGQYTPGVTYAVADYGFPYVWMPSENASSGRVYYMLLFGSFRGTTDNTPATNQKGNSAGTGQWLQIPYSAVQMVEMLIADGGKVGSAVFWEEFMFSQFGTDANGTPTMDYGAPVQAGGTFTPNFLIDFLKGDIYARTGYFSGFTRRVPTILTPKSGICQVQTDIFQHDINQTSGIIKAPSSRVNFLMPDLNRCGAWIVFADDDDYTFGNACNDQGAEEVLLVMPFMEPFHVSYDYNDSIDKSFGQALMIINSWSPNVADTNTKAEIARAISYQGCKVEITNLSQQTIFIRGLRGYKWGNNQVQNAWDTFQLVQNQTLIATCSSYGTGNDVAALMSAAAIAWDIESYVINVDIDVASLKTIR